MLPGHHLGAMFWACLPEEGLRADPGYFGELHLGEMDGDRVVWSSLLGLLPQQPGLK